MNTDFFLKDVKLGMSEWQLKVIKNWAKKRKIEVDDMIQLVFEEGYSTLRAEENQED